MQLHFTQNELRILRHWGQNSTQSGHWGNGNWMLGEESSVVAKLKDASEGDLSFNPLEIRVLNYWRESNYGALGSPGGLPGEAELAVKLNDAFQNMHKA